MPDIFIKWHDPRINDCTEPSVTQLPPWHPCTSQRTQTQPFAVRPRKFPTSLGYIWGANCLPPPGKSDDIGPPEIACAHMHA